MLAAFVFKRFNHFLLHFISPCINAHSSSCNEVGTRDFIGSCIFDRLKLSEINESLVKELKFIAVLLFWLWKRWLRHGVIKKKKDFKLVQCIPECYVF